MTAAVGFDDDRRLERLGNRPELPRSRSSGDLLPYGLTCMVASAPPAGFPAGRTILPNHTTLREPRDAARRRLRSIGRRSR